MSLVDEYSIRKLLAKAHFYAENVKENESYQALCNECIEQVHQTLSTNVRSSFINISYETFIQFAETTIQIKGQEHLAKYYLDLFFQRNTSRGQMYIRALLCYARVIAHQGQENQLKAEENINNLQKALGYVTNAIEIIARPENKQKYAFLIYNASVCVYHIIRPMFRPDWQKHFSVIIEKLVKLLEEVDEPDHSWLCRFTWMLFHCVYDSEKKPDALKIFEKLWDLTKKKGDCDFQDNLFRLRIHLAKDSSGLVNTVKKEAETAPLEKGWRQLVILQLIKSGLIPEAQVEKELTIMINSISPGILTGNDLSPGSTKRSPIIQERLAEAGRVALSFNLLNITEAISNYLNKVRQLSQKARIMLEYIKAEYLLKKPGPVVDPKTNMRLNSVQIKRQEIERRSEALRIMEKVMGTNKRVNDPELIYEGAIIIWNLSLPFLNANHKQLIYEPFVAACNLLEMIQSSNVQLRANFHLEIAKIEIEQGFFMKAEQNLNKGLALDYSIAINKIKEKPNAEEDLSLYQRPYDRYLKLLQDRVSLKQKIHAVPEGYIESVIMELETAASSKNENMRMEVLQKCLGTLVSNEEPEFYNDPAKEMVTEEVEAARIKHKQHNLYMYKQKKLLAGEVCKQAFDWELADIAIRASEFVLADNWEPKNAAEMILNQAECSYIMALSFIDLLSKENFEIAFADPVKINAEDQDNNEEQEPLSPRKVDQVLQYKKDIVKYLIQGLKLAKSVGQSWLIFNGAIYIWNNYLPVFRNPSNDSKLLSEILNLLGEFFQALKDYNKELEKKYIPDYDLESKMLVYANIGIIYARLLESKSQYDEVVKACEALLLSPLNPHTRKLINSIKARTSGMAKTTGKAQAVDKNKNQAAASQNNDQLLFDVVSQLEIIQNNTNKAATPDLIKKCYETLNTWKAKENDETELELHAELWARLAKLALNEQTTDMYKYALKSVEMSLFLLKENQDLSKIPVSRLRWYSLANYLYGETLSYMINPQTQEKESQEKLLFYALKHSEEAAHKGCKADINILVLDAAKQFWNICTRLKDSATNRKALIKPIFTMMYYLKTVKENTEPDLILLLNRLLTQAALENNEFELGESVTDMAFELVPKHLQRTLWESKMVFLSKQGKNELQAINNMKEADQNLQARLWIRLARTSVNTNKQYVAYQKAIEIFRKEESIEIADVLIEFSEWLLRNGYEYKMINDNLVEAANVLIDIEIEQKDEDDEEEGGDNARSSIYSKSSRRLSSVSKSVKSKHTVKSSATSKAKKTQEVKSTMSKGGGKSRLSVGSRLSRASLRGTTNMKAKVSKSFFAEREEEGNPEKLNVTHFDKLMRVYGMLAMLAKTSEEALQFCLDAKLFLLKIFELSYKTLNTMEQAAAKLSIINKDKDEKNVKGAAGHAQDKQGEANAAEDLKVALPLKPEEWINYQVPKEFIERIRTTENTNVMSKITFEKAELSYIYLDYIIKTLEGLGHHVHCLEIYSFLRFFVKEILNSPSQIVTLIECKYARFLFSLGLKAEGESIYKNLSFTKFFPNSIERKNILAKVEASVVGYRPKATAEGGEAISDKKANKKPNMVKEIHLHQVWIDLAQEFIYFGEINKARTLLDFAFDYARILNDIENLGFIEHLRAQVHYLEGKYSEALEDSMRGHRYPKILGNWRQNVLGTYKTLWKLEKEKDVDMMLGKVETVFLEMQGDKQFEGNERELNHNLLMMYLIRLLNGSKSMLKTKQPEKNLESMKEIFDKLPAQITKSGLLCEHIEVFQAIARKLNKYCENAPIRDDALVIHYNILEKIVEIATTFADQVEQLLKYSVKTSVLTSPLIVTNAYLKVLQAVSICNFGIVKNHLKYIKLHVRKAESRDKGASPGRSPKRSAQEKSKTALQQKKNLTASVDNFMRRLTLKVEAESQLTKQRFDSYEKASSILSSVVNSFPSHSHLKIVCKLALAKVKRLLAYYNKQMGKVWGISKSPEQMVYESDEEEPKKNEAFDYKSDALKGIMDLLTGEQPKMIELFFIPEFSLDFGLNFSQEMIENFGLMNPDITFEYLTRYQNAIHLKWLKRIMKNAASSTHRFFILERLSKFSYRSLRTENQSLSTVVLNEFKLADILYKNIEYRTIKTELLPNNSAYLILQMPPNELFLYIGFMHINQNREFKYHMQKYYFKEKDQAEIKDMIDSINSMKLELQRTPHTTAKDLADLEARYANRSKEIQQRLEDFCSFFMGNIDAIINPSVPETEPEPVPVDSKAKGGAAAKDAAKDKNAGKKGAPGEVQAYQSNLPTPSSGIESLVLLLDERLTALPWEGLRAFKKVPVISRDFSMNIYAKRLRNIGFKPELNNSQGIAKDKMKYVVYEFKTPPEGANQAGGVSGSQSAAPGSAASNVTGELRTQQGVQQGQQQVTEKVPEIAPLFKEIQKQNPAAGIKIEGVASSERIPSLGEWESYLRDGSMLMYFGNPSILNILTPRIMLDVLEVCNVKGYVVIDRVNSRKSTIEKFDALEPNPEKVFMHEQPLQTLALLTALGSSFVMMNNWPVKAEEDLKLLETFMKNANEGNYLAKGLSQYKEPEVVYMDSTGKIVKKEEEKEDPKAVKKGGKEPPKKDAGKGKEEKAPTTGDGKTTDEGGDKEEIKEVQIIKHGIYNDCFVYYGVPVVRLSS